MNSLKEVYSNLTQHDHVKVAAARAAQGLPPQVDMSQFDDELIKRAQDYDQIGRVLAHHVYTDLVKQALDEAGVPEEKKEDELARLMAVARGEKPAEEKKEEAKDEGGEGEKKEAAKRAKKKAILAKMAADPAYVSQLVAKHTGR